MAPVQHFCRMNLAMGVAAASMFRGPRGRAREVIYVPALLPIPALMAFVVMAYCLSRRRGKRRPRRGLGIMSTQETAIARVSV
jgi:hypothetical protein